MKMLNFGRVVDSHEESKRIAKIILSFLIGDLQIVIDKSFFQLKRIFVDTMIDC